MQIPGWSTFIIVPAFFFTVGFRTIRQSQSPIALCLIIGGVSFVVAFVAWGLLTLLDKWRR